MSEPYCLFCLDVGFDSPKLVHDSQNLCTKLGLAQYKQNNMQQQRLRWRALWQPEMYHGWGRTHNYFEGWYFKLVDPSGQHVFAVIPGVSYGQDGQAHAFIQVLDGVQCKAHYERFPVEVFQPSPQGFEVHMGNNFFSGERLQLDLPQLKGSLVLTQPHPWPKMLGAPGIMGWFSFIPFMECYHGVVSMHHQLKGELEVNGQRVDFTGGIGYIEKDWGRSFPRAWIWMQSNHFNSPDPMCLMASVAHIPWLGSHFVGYIVGFLWEGQLYRFATYTGAKMQVDLGEREVKLAFFDRKNRLEITAYPAPGAQLVSPISGEMTGKVNESMQAVLAVSFYERGKLRYTGEGKNAGLELAGALDALLKN